MKTVIIFWLNPKTGVIFHKTISQYIFRQVGEVNQFGNEIIAMCILEDKRLKCFNNFNEMTKKEEPKRNKIIDKVIYKLESLKRWLYGRDSWNFTTTKWFVRAY